MRYPKLRELKEAIRALIKGPYTSRFPYQPHQPYESFRGKPEFYEKDCVGCGACFEVCPAKAIDIEDVEDKRSLTVHLDMCIFCGQCQANCPTEKGIMLSQEFDLATTGKREDLLQLIEKELVLCAGCGEVIAPYDQILWVAKRLGPLTFSNASLMLFYVQNLDLSRPFYNVADASGMKERDLSLKERLPTKEEFSRSDRIKILCPRCRREAVLKS